MEKSPASAVSLGAMVLASAAEPAAAQTPPPTVNTSVTPAQRLMRAIAPKLADLTDTVLFGDVWERLNAQAPS
jgi:4-carboxymuconolactone decarboxylase